jgi:short-subunit dehydrogenase
MDLAQPGAASELWTELTRIGASIDVLVNNAGIGLYGELWEQDVDTIRQLLVLNVEVLTLLTRHALPGMLERRWGRILNLASLLAYQPGGPRMAAYYASKSFVLSFSKGLAMELRGSGVTVTALCPGLTKTQFMEHSGATGSILDKTPTSSPASVAREGYKGLMRGRAVVIPGLLTKILAIAGELPPRRIALAVNEYLLRRA